MNDNLNWFLNNREVIKALSLNTGTSAVPVFTTMCTTSEVALATDFEKKDFYVYCDAIKRSLITGASLTLETTVKIDMNNSAVVASFAKLHTVLKDGTVAQYNNQLIQFDLLEKVENDVLTYVKYQVPVTMTFADLGGAAEDEAEFSLELSINGKATVVTV